MIELMDARHINDHQFVCLLFISDPLTCLLRLHHLDLSHWGDLTLFQFLAISSQSMSLSSSTSVSAILDSKKHKIKFHMKNCIQVYNLVAVYL